MIIYFTIQNPMNDNLISNQVEEENILNVSEVFDNSVNDVTNVSVSNADKTTDERKFPSPLSSPAERITKKPFGIKITKADSPVQPERFSGYHTGTDLEVFAGEINSEVEVRSFCSGQIKMKTTASGYGGVVVQKCELEGQPVTIIYGHMKIDSVDFAVNSNIEEGEHIGLLGDDKSTETDGERKHLHFAIHKGSEINIRGYVQSEVELKDWIDPELYLDL